MEILRENITCRGRILSKYIAKGLTLDAML